MNSTYYRISDGRDVPKRVACDERGILRDGFACRSLLMLKDGDTPMSNTTDKAVAAYRAATTLQLTADAAEAERLRAIGTGAAPARPLPLDDSAQAAYERRVSDAWRGGDTTPSDAAQVSARRHDPWKGGGNPPRNAGQSKEVSPGAMAHGVDPADDRPSASQQAYERRLREAWRG